METQWITTEEAMEILGMGRMPVNRLAREGKVIARVAESREGKGKHPWEFDRASVEARAERMKNRPAEDSPDLSKWIPITEAMAVLRMTRHGVKRRMKMGLLDSIHFGPPEKQALYVDRVQVFEQAAKPPEYERRTHWEMDAEEAFVAWFAGFFDGEGCVTIRKENRARKQSGCLTLTLPNTYFPAIDAIEETIGGKVHHRRAQTETRKETRVWNASAAEAAAILKRIRPHMRVKHAQADLALEWQERVERSRYGRWNPMPTAEKEWREQQRLKISALNRRGPAQ